MVSKPELISDIIKLFGIDYIYFPKYLIKIRLKSYH